MNKKGFTIAEVLVATTALAALMLSIAKVTSNIEKKSRIISERIVRIGWFHQFNKLMAEPDFVKEQILKNNKNRKLKGCLVEGCGKGVSGKVFVNLKDNLFSEMEFKMRFRQLTPNIVLLEASFISEDTFIKGRSAKVYLSRKDFLELPEENRLKAVECQRGDHLVGFNLNSWESICSIPPTKNSIEASPYSLPFALGRGWQ